MSGKKFDENDSAVIDHEQDRYQHSEVLWKCESLSQKAAQHILFYDAFSDGDKCNGNFRGPYTFLYQLKSLKLGREQRK